MFISYSKVKDFWKLVKLQFQGFKSQKCVLGGSYHYKTKHMWSMKTIAPIIYSYGLDQSLVNLCKGVLNSKVKRSNTICMFWTKERACLFQGNYIWKVNKSHTSNQSKIKGKVKVFADKQTYRRMDRTKSIYPKIFAMGA